MVNHLGHTAWPHLLADLTAKRDALTGLIETIRTHFVNDADPSRMPESPIRKRKALRTQTNKQTNKARRGPRGTADGASLTAADTTRPCSRHCA
jgi:hypothetical protein